MRMTERILSSNFDPTFRAYYCNLNHGYKPRPEAAPNVELQDVYLISQLPIFCLCDPTIERLSISHTIDAFRLL
jgi:hypothetical protein